MKSIEILTCNSMYKDGECVGGYHEIHKINYLQNIHHFIATIDSIINNNLQYGCNDTVLESILVYCNDWSAINIINEYFKGKYKNIKIEANCNQ